MSKYLVICVAAVCCLAGCEQARQTEPANPDGQVGLAAQRLADLELWLAAERWEAANGASADSLEFFQELKRHLLADPKLFRAVQLVDTSGESGAARANALMARLALWNRVESHPNVRDLRDSLEQELEQATVLVAGELLTLPAIAERLERATDNATRAQLQRARRELAPRFADPVGRLIRMRNFQAGRLGYRDFLAVASRARGFEEAEYTELIGTLDEALTSSALPPDSNGWTLDRFFPIDTQLSMVTTSLEVCGFDLDRLPVYMDVTEGAAFAESDVFPLQPAFDIRLKAHLHASHGSVREMLFGLGQAMHWMAGSQAEGFFASFREPIWADAMGQVFALMADEPVWLRNAAGLPGEAIDAWREPYRRHRARLLRQLIEEARFEIEAYRADGHDLDELYSRITGGGSSAGEWAGLPSLIRSPLAPLDHLWAQAAAAQTTAYLARTQGAVSYDPNTSAFLVQNYLRFGSRYDWRDLLKRGTGEQLNPEHLIASVQ